MGIPGDIQNELITALTFAFPDKQKLKMMLKLKLNFTLTIDTNDIAAILFELIDNNQIEINRLIRGALRSIPNNREIQNFVKNHLKFLVSNIGETIKANLIIDLISILEQINNFDYVVNTLKKILPDPRISYIAEDIKNLDNSRIDKSIKIFLILEILVKDYPYDVKNQELLLIFVFVADLLTNTNDQQLQQKLETWQDDAKRQGYKLPVIESDSSDDDDQDTCNWLPYLSIVIQQLPSSDPDRCSLLGYLILESTGDRDQKVKLIPLQNYIVNDPKSQNNSEIVNYKSSNQFDFSFSEAKTEEGKKIIAKQLGLLIDESYEKIRDRNLVLDNSDQDNSKRDLVIEFFLPGKHFFENVDSWEIPYGVFGDFIQITKKYNVIIRSYDRLDNPRLLTILERSWSRINNIINDIPADLEEDDLLNYYQKNYAKLTNMTGIKSIISKEIKEKIGLKLICEAPPSCQNCKTLINVILEEGLPIIVWAKCKDNPCKSLFNELEQFLSPNLINNPNDLSTLVHQQRLKAFEAFEEKVNETNQLIKPPDPNRHFGCYLTIYFEETNRLSKLHNYFKENIQNNRLRLGE